MASIHYSVHPAQVTVAIGGAATSIGRMKFDTSLGGNCTAPMIYQARVSCRGTSTVATPLKAYFVYAAGGTEGAAVAPKDITTLDTADLDLQCREATTGSPSTTNAFGATFVHPQVGYTWMLIDNPIVFNANGDTIDIFVENNGTSSVICQACFWGMYTD